MVLVDKDQKPIIHGLSRVTSLDIGVLNEYGQPVAGVDEVGVGSIAGPLCACALVVHSVEEAAAISLENLWVNDSKMLYRNQRELLFPRITAVSTYAIGWVSVEEINETRNIRTSGFIARQRAVTNLITQGVSLKAIISDAFKIEANLPCIAVPKADSKSFIVACASIIAKCTRDWIIIAMHEQYPSYDFGHNVGYATPKHMWALRKFGQIPGLHRPHIIGKYIQHYMDAHWDELFI